VKTETVEDLREMVYEHDEDDHFVCCDDENLSLCGKNDNDEIEGYADTVSCVECMERHHHDICPKHGLCAYPKDEEDE
jgi:hypothetical protein